MQLFRSKFGRLFVAYALLVGLMLFDLMTLAYAQNSTPPAFPFHPREEAAPPQPNAAEPSAPSLDSDAMFCRTMETPHPLPNHWIKGYNNTEEGLDCHDITQRWWEAQRLGQDQKTMPSVRQK
jgi:hypothetical protein